jgi:hypothetical protein
LAINGNIHLNQLMLDSTLELRASAVHSDKLTVQTGMHLDGARLKLPEFDPSHVGEALVVATYGSLDGTFDLITGLPEEFHIEYAWDDGNHSRNIAIVQNTEYQNWAWNASELEGEAAEFDADANGDGVPNGLAWYLGATNAMEDARPHITQFVRSANAWEYSYSQMKAGENLVVDASHDLVNWETVVNGQDGVTIEQSENPANTDLEEVMIRFPESDPGQELFLRIRLE